MDTAWRTCDDHVIIDQQLGGGGEVFDNPVGMLLSPQRAAGSVRSSFVFAVCKNKGVAQTS